MNNNIHPITDTMNTFQFERKIYNGSSSMLCFVIWYFLQIIDTMSRGNLGDQLRNLMRSIFFILFFTTSSPALSSEAINEYDQAEIKELIETTHSVSCQVIGTETYKLAMMRQEGLSRAKVYEEGFKNYENLVSEALDIILEETKDIFPDKFWTESNLYLFRDILVPREDLQKTGHPDYLDAIVDAIFSRPKFPLKTWQEQEAQQTREFFISNCTNLTVPMEFVKQFSELITTP